MNQSFEAVAPRAPCDLMPDEMTIRASIYPCRPGSIQLLLKTKDETFGIGGEGKTLAEAAANLFGMVERFGGVPGAAKMAGDNARAAGFIPIEPGVANGPL